MMGAGLIHITSTNQLRSVADRWDELWRRSEISLPTAKAEPLSLWVETCAPAADFFALVVEEDGRWTAALPLVGGKLRRLLSAGIMKWLPPGGPLLLDQRTVVEKTLDVLMAGIRQVPWGILWLDEVDLRAPRWQAFLGAAEQAGFSTSIHRRYSVGRVLIDHDWQAYRMRWSQRHRRNMKRALRKLAELSDVAWEFLWDLEEPQVAEWVRRGFEIEHRSWKGRQGTSVIAKGQLPYITRQAELLARSGHLGLAFLRADQRYIAFCYGFHAKGVYHTFKIAYDPDLAAFSPGQLLFYGLLEHLFSNCDFWAMDTVGELTEAVAHWRPEVYDIGTIMLAPRRLAGRIATYIHKSWWPYVRQIRCKIANPHRRSAAGCSSGCRTSGEQGN